MTVIENTTATVAFEVTRDGVPYDLSGATEIEISLKQDIPEKVLSKLLSDGDVVISGDSNEIATANFTPTETLQFVSGFVKAQIRVEMNDTVIGNVAIVCRVAEALSQEAL